MLQSNLRSYLLLTNELRLSHVRIDEHHVLHVVDTLALTAALVGEVTLALWCDCMPLMACAHHVLSR